MNATRDSLPSYQELERQKAHDRLVEASCHSVSDVVSNLLKRLAPTRSRNPQGRIEEIRDVWKEAVGNEIARRTTPSRYREGVLTVTVDTAPLASELQSFGEQALIGDLSQRGLDGLHTIRFQTGDRPDGRAAGEGH